MPQHQVDHPRVVRQSYQTSRRFDRSIPGAQSAPGIGRPVCKDVRSEESSDLAVRQCCGTCGERSAGVRPPLLRHGGQGVGHVRRQSIGGRVPLSHSGDRRHIKRALHEVAKRNRAGAPCPQVFDGEREARKSSPRVVINQPHRERLSQPPRVPLKQAPGMEERRKTGRGVKAGVFLVGRKRRCAVNNPDRTPGGAEQGAGGRAVVRERHGDATGIGDRLPRKLPARQGQGLVPGRALDPASAGGVGIVKDAPSVIAAQQCRPVGLPDDRGDSWSRGRDDTARDQILQPREVGRFDGNGPVGGAAPPRVLTAVACVNRQHVHGRRATRRGLSGHR